MSSKSKKKNISQLNYRILQLFSKEQPYYFVCFETTLHKIMYCRRLLWLCHESQNYNSIEFIEKLCSTDKNKNIKLIYNLLNFFAIYSSETRKGRRVENISECLGKVKIFDDIIKKYPSNYINNNAELWQHYFLPHKKHL